MKRKFPAQFTTRNPYEKSEARGSKREPYQLQTRPLSWNSKYGKKPRRPGSPLICFPRRQNSTTLIFWTDIMPPVPTDITFFFLAASFILTAGFSPLTIVFLKKFGVTRHDEKDISSFISGRKEKTGTPIMGGLLIVLVVSALTILFNWHRESTYVPIGVFLLSALLGGADDLLNIFYHKPRPVRTLGRVMRLIRTHKSVLKRIEYTALLPWHAYKRFFYLLGSHPGSGIQAHEKIIAQFITGVIIAWWLSFKIEWTEIWIPWIGHLDLGLWIIPIIVFLVMFMANAVNISDGIDGLSAGSLILAYGAYFIIAIQQGSAEITFLLAAIIGALAGYLLFNIKPAKYQIGDVASLGL